MKNCLNCGKEVIQTPGKKEKKYCDAKCKQQHWHKLKADKKDMVKISREEYNRLKSVELKESSICFPYERITDKLKESLEVNKKDLAKYIGKRLKENNPDKVAGKVVVKELNKEGSKPYNPNDNPFFNKKNGIKK